MEGSGTRKQQRKTQGGEGLAGFECSTHGFTDGYVFIQARVDDSKSTHSRFGGGSARLFEPFPWSFFCATRVALSLLCSVHARAHDMQQINYNGRESTTTIASAPMAATAEASEVAAGC